MKKILFFLLVSVLFGSCKTKFQSNNPKDILIHCAEVLNNSDCYGYEINRVDIYNSAGKIDTFIENNGKVIFKRQLNNQLVPVQYKISCGKWYSIINNKFSFWVDSTQKLIQFDTIRTNDIVNWSEYYSHNNLLRNFLITTIEGFKSMIESADTILLKNDTAINNQICYNIEVHFSASNSPDFFETRHYFFDKTTFYPVKVNYKQTYMDGGDNETIVFKNFHSIVYNENDFKVDYSQLKNTNLKVQSQVTENRKIRERVQLNLGGMQEKKWSVKTLDNKTVTENDFAGQFHLIDFYYNACGPCMMCVPALNAIQAKHKQIKIIGFNAKDDDVSAIKKMATIRNIQYPLYYNAELAAKNWDVVAFPRMFLIDPQGTIIYDHSGYEPRLETLLDSVIQLHLNPKK